MPSSTVSLEPLSSPSPSPPPPETHTTVSSTSNHSGAGAGLDSGSELSELTEDEQENDKNKKNDEEPPRPPRRGGRKKRGGIVPAPMWGWAYKTKPKTDWKTKMIEEEEEEEQAGPAEAMEEEEDEDHEGSSRAVTSTVPEDPVENGDPDADDEDAPDDYEDLPDADDDDPSTTPIEDLPANEEKLDVDDDEGEGEAEDEEDVVDAPPSRPLEREPSPDPSEDENADDEEGEPEVPIEDDDPRDPNPPLESEDEADNGAESEVPNGLNTEIPPTPLDPTPPSLSVNVEISEPPEPMDTDPIPTPMEVDETIPTPVVVTPIVAAVAASSIMAGSEVIIHPPPSSSSEASGTPRVSPSPSRSPSREPGSDHDTEQKAESGRVSAKAKALITRGKNVRSTRARAKRKAKDATLDQDGDGDRLPHEGDDRDAVDVEDVDVDSPEMDVESDLQPEHRTQALDELAKIELRFALLRERLYVEKIEGLAWEEALINEGTHPEMLHLHAELSARRDKRLDLASRRRDYEVSNVTKRRKLDEEGVWSWWKNARDDLQVEMTSEANRRRRRLDRERRALDRPQPVRHIPNAPHDIPPPPTLREIVKAYPFNKLSRSKSKKHPPPVTSLVYPQLTTLSPMDISADIDFLLTHRRPPVGFDPARAGIIGNNPMFGFPGGIPPGYDQYSMNMAMIDGPGPGPINRFGQPPLQHIQPSQMQGQVPPGYLGSGPIPGGRIANVSAPQPGMGNLSHSQMLMEQEILATRRPSSASQPSHMQPFPMVANGPLMRRSISPAPIQSLSNGQTLGMAAGPPSSGGPKPQSWMGMGGAGPSSLPGGKEKRVNGGFPEVQDREKDRERERLPPDAMKLRERNEQRDIEHERELERAYIMQHGPQRHAPYQHPHQHVHAPSNPVPHHHLGPHHHHHHHHHVHHHHHPNPTGVPGGGGQLPPANDAGPASVTSSPRASRELELRRPHSSAPVDAIDAPTAPKQIAPSSMFSYWKDGDEPPAPPSSNPPRERERLPFGPPPTGPHDRMIPNFVMTPSMQSSYPTSPRSKMPSGSRAHSRRGSWSIPEDSNVPRPSSSSSLGPSTSNHLQLNSAGSGSGRQPSSGGPLARAQASPLLQPQHTPILPSPRNNGLKLPPLSPSQASTMIGSTRSPARAGQSLPPSSLPPSHCAVDNRSLPKLSSPNNKVYRQSPPPGATRSPVVHNSSAGPTGPLPALTQRTSSPINLFPPPSSLSVPPLPAPRLPPPVGVVSEKHSPHLPSAPKMNAVPIDGS